MHILFSGGENLEMSFRVCFFCRFETLTHYLFTSEFNCILFVGNTLVELNEKKEIPQTNSVYNVT